MFEIEVLPFLLHAASFLLKTNIIGQIIAAKKLKHFLFKDVNLAIYIEGGDFY